MSRLHVVVGGQFGSEAKGHVAGHLAKDERVGAVVRVAGPNAGHTAYDKDGTAWALRQIPVAAVTNPECELMLAAGSEIDPDVLGYEVDELERVGFEIRDRLVIDPQATVIGPEHKETERWRGLTRRVGSTAKGIGAARAARVMREAETADTSLRANYPVADVAAGVRAHISRQEDVVIEGTQGYGLGLHAGYYPFCTSSDCRAIDFLAMVGVSPWSRLEYRGATQLLVWPVFRTYPIRVAGNSGPLSGELTWEEMAERTNGHAQPERTTVTQLVRRIGEWDPVLARAAMIANGAPSDSVKPVLTFLDYEFPDLANKAEIPDGHPAWEFLETRSQELDSTIALVATGPNTIIDLWETR